MTEEPDTSAANIYYTLREFPVLGDLLSLNMHAMDVDIVDLNLREWETKLAAEHAASDHTPVDSAMTVRAFTRGWVFLAYELLRTWMQMTQRLLALRKAARKREAAGASAQDLQSLLGGFKQESEVMGTPFDPSWKCMLERAVASDNLATELDRARAIVAPVFAVLEAMRVKLAKHELHGQKRGHLFDAGYFRIDSFTGSLGCMVEQKDGTSIWTTRLDLSDSLRALRFHKS